MGALGNARAAHLCSVGNGLEDGVHIHLVLRACHDDFYFLVVCRFLLLILFHGCLFHVRHHFTQCVDDLLCGHALTDNDEYGVVAGYRA